MWRDVHHYSETSRIVVLVAMCCASLMLSVPLIIGYLRFSKMIKMSKFMIIQKRYPNIVLLESKLALIVPLIVSPLFTLISTELPVFDNYQDILNRIFYTLVPSVHLVFGTETARLWLMCYDLNYLNASKSVAWTSQIDEGVTDNNWWLNNRSKYGNYHYVTRAMIIFSLSTAITSCIMLHLFGWNPLTQLIDSLLYGIGTSFMLYSYYKCPKINDKFYFQFEFKLTCICYIVGLSMFAITFILLFFYQFIAETMTAFVGMMTMASVSILSTVYIPNKITKHKTLPLIKHIHNSEKFKQQMSLQDILLNENSLELFASHLSLEFSLECLLSFIEFVQYKIHFQNMLMNINDQFIYYEERKIEFRFNGEVKSSIVYNTMSTISKTFKYKYDPVISESSDTTKTDEVVNGFKKIVHKLFSKYIKTGGDLEINISAELRNKLYAIMEDKEDWIKHQEMSIDDLYKIFDDVMMEMFYLLDTSSTRFVNFQQDHTN